MKLKQHCKRCKDSAPGKFCLWCMLQSVAFPLEHFIWERLPGFSWVTIHVLGIS